MGTDWYTDFHAESWKLTYVQVMSRWAMQQPSGRSQSDNDRLPRTHRAKERPRTLEQSLYVESTLEALLVQLYCKKCAA